MRKLTVSINAAHSSQLGNIHLYIESEVGNTRISGILCKKLGEVTEGSSASFNVENGNLKLFAIPEYQGQNFEYNPFRLPVGESDIAIIGVSKVDEKGNPSLTLGLAQRPAQNKPAVKDIAMKEQPKAKTVKKETTGEKKKSNPVVVTITVILAMVIGLLVGYTATSAIINATKDRSKTFTVDDMSITLTGHFNKDKDAKNYTAAYASEDVAVFVNRDFFTQSKDMDTWTTEDYLDVIITMYSTRYGFDIVGVNKDSGIPFFTYTGASHSNGQAYIHCVYAYKTDDAFWTVEFAIAESNRDAYLDKISEWAHTVSFK